MSHSPSTVTGLAADNSPRKETVDPEQARKETLDEITALLERNVALMLASDPELNSIAPSNDRIRQKVEAMKSAIFCHGSGRWHLQGR